MIKVLVVGEARAAELLPITHELTAAARQALGDAGGEVEVLIASGDAMAIASQVKGADRVVAMSHESLAAYVPEAHKAALIAAIDEGKPDLVVTAYDSVGLDLGAGVAASTGRGFLGYCNRVEINGASVAASCQAYAGKLEVRVEAALPAVVAINPGAYKENENAVSTSEALELSAPASLGTLKSRVLSTGALKADAIDITQVDRLVSVGRGIGDAASIDGAKALADALGAEIAGSRPVIDNGWLPKERQVGKSGRTVKPALYLALGVSGAPEHLEGMKNAGLIIAINTDEAAPIFEVAHYGATIDLFELLPVLTEKLAAGRG